jgi:uncharacterized protein with PIN domain
MLGKLAKYLRILGFDAVYLRSVTFLERYIGEDSLRDDHEYQPPYFLTRRQKMFPYPRTIRLRSEHVREQLKELSELIKATNRHQKFLTRCINCNVPLADVEKETIEHRVPEFVFHTYNVFRMCPECKRIYWAGTHTQRMAELMEDLRTNGFPLP